MSRLSFSFLVSPFVQREFKPNPLLVQLTHSLSHPRTLSHPFSPTPTHSHRLSLIFTHSLTLVRGFETGQFRVSLTPEPARGQPGGHLRGEVNFYLTQCCPELQRVVITRIPPHGLEGQLLSLQGMSGAPKQAQSGESECSGPPCPTPVAGRQSAEGACGHTLRGGRAWPGRRVRPHAASPPLKESPHTRRTRLHNHTTTCAHSQCLSCTCVARAARTQQCTLTLHVCVRSRRLVLRVVCKKVGCHLHSSRRSVRLPHVTWHDGTTPFLVPQDVVVFRARALQEVFPDLA